MDDPRKRLRLTRLISRRLSHDPIRDRAQEIALDSPAYAPTTASSIRSSNLCRGRCRSPIATDIHRTPHQNKTTRPREAKPFTRLVITRRLAYVRNITEDDILPARHS